MAEHTNIAWCDSTWNPWIGCTKVSPGCDHCYASVSTPARAMKIAWGAGQQRRRTSPSNWQQPLRWNEKAEKSGRPWRVFCASLADVFDNEVPDQWRDDLFVLIRATPFLTWLLLTKRIGNVRSMMPARYLAYPFHNVWLGATVVNQAEADRDVPKLLATPAAKRFVSYEPALGPVEFDPLWLRASPSAAYQDGRVTSDMPAWTRIGAHALDWIIVGGESNQPGMRARPFDIGWARSTVEQCRDAGVACFVKQIGARPIRYECAMRERCTHPDCGPRSVTLRDRAGADPAEWPEDLRVREFPR